METSKETSRDRDCVPGYGVITVTMYNWRYVLLRQDDASGEIAFYMKGADVVMHNVVQYNDWMDEEVSRSCCCHSILLTYCFS